MAYPYPNPYGGCPNPGGYPGFQPSGYPTPSYPGMAYPSAAPKTFYVIKSRLNNLVLDVEGGGRNPGTRVITWQMKNWGEWDNQLWYDDPMTGTIRSKKTGYCLDISGSNLIINPYFPGNTDQLWERFDTIIRNRQAQHRVLDIEGSKQYAGAKIIVWDHNGGANQQFDFIYIPGLTEPYIRREFFILSEMHNKALDISGGNPSAGSDIIVWPKKNPPEKNQLWYFDPQGVIFSALNNMVLDSRGGNQLRTMPYQHHPYQQWTVIGNRIQSKTGGCLDIQGGQMKDGASVISFAYKASSNQHWRLEFV